MKEREPLKIEKQEKKGWCFLPCAKAVLEYHGEHKTQEELKEVFNTTEEHGTGIYNAIGGFQNLGYEVHYKTRANIFDLERCLKAELPTIVCWWHDLEGEPEGHYSLVENIWTIHSFKSSKSMIMINLLDPEIGRKRTMPYREFEKRWWSKEGDRRIEQPLIVVGDKGKNEA